VLVLLPVSLLLVVISDPLVVVLRLVLDSVDSDMPVDVTPVSSSDDDPAPPEGAARQAAASSSAHAKPRIIRRSSCRSG
jgi:hypothetical protein